MTGPTRLHEPPVAESAPTQHPSAQILTSAAELARAEVRLLWSHARQVGSRAALALSLTWFAMLLTQIALLMLAASPIIFAAYGSTILIASVAPAVALAAIVWSVSVKKWLKVGATGEARTAGEHSPLELSTGELGRR
jgi:hypothetical protein